MFATQRHVGEKTVEGEMHKGDLIESCPRKQKHKGGGKTVSVLISTLCSN